MSSEAERNSNSFGFQFLDLFDLKIESQMFLFYVNTYVSNLMGFAPPRLRDYIYYGIFYHGT